MALPGATAGVCVQLDNDIWSTFLARQIVA
jgi:hypothetical protein